MNPQDPKVINVTSFNQRGGITANQVNIQKQDDRHITEEVKQQLRNLFLSKEETIDLTAVMGDQEAFQFAQEIKSFLIEDGYTKVNGVNQAIFSNPIKGQSVEPGQEGSPARIVIGGR